MKTGSSDSVVNHTSETLDNTRQQRDTERMNSLNRAHIKRNSFFLWFLGFINNFHYCLVLAAANDLATGYGFKHLIALISWCNIFFGIFVRMLSVSIGTHISYNLRIAITTLCGLVGVLLVSFASPIGFGSNAASFCVILFGVVMVGIESTYGESSLLSFVQIYPADSVGAWSSGTGISGVIATLMFLALTAANLKSQEIFLISIPFFAVYWFSFELGLLSPHKVITVTSPGGSVRRHVIPWGREEEFINDLRVKAQISGDTVDNDYTIEMLTNLFGLPWGSIPKVVTEDESERQWAEKHGADADDLHYSFCRFLCGWCSFNNSLRRWWRHNRETLTLMHNSMLGLYLNLAIVYVEEYSAQFMAPFSFYCNKSWPSNYWIKNSYAVSQLCYRIGVLVSRSSLLCVKISAVGVLSIIQFFNAAGWLIQAKTLFISSKSNYDRQIGLSFLLFTWMIFVGLMGGASYVNIFYLILRRSDADEEREIDVAVQAYLSQFENSEDEQSMNGKMETKDMGRVHSAQNMTMSHISTIHTPHETADSTSSAARVDVDESRTYPYGVNNTSLLVSRTDEQRKHINNIQVHIHAVWQERRAMGMQIGALYASLGITCGTLLDLVFTNTLNFGDRSC